MARTSILLCTGIVLLAGNAVAQSNVFPGPAPYTATETAKPESVQQQLDEIRKDLQNLVAVQLEDRAQLQQLAKKDKNGNSYVRIDASQEPVRNEFRNAIEASIPTSVEVIIHNDMPRTQLIAINGTQYSVMSNTDLPVSVPYGQYSVRLPDQQPEFRYAGFPGENKVLIRPQYQQYQWVNYSPAQWNVFQ